MLNVKRLIKISILYLAAVEILIYTFSKSLNYSIMFSLGFGIGVAGFVVLIRTVDRCLKKGKGQFLFFTAAFLKMAAIAGGFFLASRVSKTAVILYIVGLLSMVAAIMAHALYLVCRSVFKCKNTD
ncbi:MAG: ATP synthase subunit I [Candidatus Aminicenantes bacterium]|nr:ATP synthase subunit I [Candidatus Aminicenantes bacterium]